MNFQSVVSKVGAVALQGQEHKSVCLRATGIDLAGSSDRVIGTLERAQGLGIVGSQSDVAVFLLRPGISFCALGNNSAVNLGDELAQGTVAGTLVYNGTPNSKTSGTVALVWDTAIPVNSLGGIINVLFVS